jgi:membrane protein YdbS with pleckstrin-like domain
MNVAKIIEMKQGERVLRVARNFWLTYLPKWFVAVLFVLLAFFLMFPLFQRGTWGIVLFAVLNAVGLWVAVRTLVRQYWNAFIITNMRVVDIDQRGFFNRLVSDASFDKIQDISYSVRGVLGTVFNYGNVCLRTAGSSATLDLMRVRDPKSLHHLIAEAIAKQRTHGVGGSREEKIASLLDAANELSESEARAFMQSLQQAITKGKVGRRTGERKDLEKDLDWYKEDGSKK